MVSIMMPLSGPGILIHVVSGHPFRTALRVGNFVELTFLNFSRHPIEVCLTGI
jgi:hypothetical protein